MPQFFFFNDTATTEIYTLSLHDALPILLRGQTPVSEREQIDRRIFFGHNSHKVSGNTVQLIIYRALLSAKKDRKSTRLNSSHVEISYAVFCLKKKKKNKKIQ